MRIGIATDHRGFELKQNLVKRLQAAGHWMVDFGADAMNSADDYPDYVVLLAQAVVAGTIDRGVAVCGSVVGASVCAIKIPGVRAALVHDFSARQGVEDENMNILCMGGRTWTVARTSQGNDPGCYSLQSKCRENSSVEPIKFPLIRYHSWPQAD